MKDNVPQILRSMIRDKRACLVIGAGVSIAASNNHECSSWKGLLQHGIDHCQKYGKPPLEEGMADTLRNFLKSDDLDNWLAVASIIERKLGYPDNQEWRHWLTDAMSGIYALNPNVVDAIHDLDLPILTTNYDQILSGDGRRSRRKSVVWNEKGGISRFLESPNEYVYHIHGSCLNPESVILGISSYDHLLKSEFAQFIQKLLSTSFGFVFVGYGNGLNDPNFKELIEFIGKFGSLSKNQRHFILVKEGEQSRFDEIKNLYPVVYGSEYADLPVFIRSLPFGQERYIYGVKRTHAEIVRQGEVFQDMEFCPEMVVVKEGKAKLPDKRNLVEIRKNYAISKYPITSYQWGVFVQERGPFYRKYIAGVGEHNNPIVGISYYDAGEYCAWLSNVTGQKYRLPSENEWEYAALAGSETSYWWGNVANAKYANFRKSKIGKITSVDKYPPNRWGISDMFGNVWEWVADNYTEKRASASHTEEPFSNMPSSKNIEGEHVLKGGCFYYDEDYMKVSARIHLESQSVFNSVGFRVVREITTEISSGSSFYIISLAGHYAISSSNLNGAPVVEDFSLGEHQRWIVEVLTDNLVSIRHERSKGYLSCAKSAVDYSLLTLVPQLISKNRTTSFMLERTVGGHLIRANGQNKVIDLEGGRLQKSPELIMFESHGNFNQCWRLVPC